MWFPCLASSTVPRFCRSAGLFSEHAVNTLSSLGSALDAGGSPFTSSHCLAQIFVSPGVGLPGPTGEMLNS